MQTTSNIPSDQLDPIPNEEWYLFSPGNGEIFHSFQFHAFNTVVWFQAFGEIEPAECVFREGMALCRKFERLFSRTLPHSEISRLSSSKGADVAISRETYELLQHAQYYCDKSQGLFDVTIGSATRLWDFHHGIIPGKTHLEQAIRHVNWRNLELHSENDVLFARLHDPEASIDVGGIAKGYIADELAHHFIGRGITDFVINLGGNVIAHGQKPNGKPWVVGVRDPQKPSESGNVLCALNIANASVVTSGITERFFERNGKRYHHILNAQTGMPVDTDAMSATVICERSIDAEGFSTTLLALGIEEGIAFAKAEPAIISALFVDSENNIHQA